MMQKQLSLPFVAPIPPNYITQPLQNIHIEMTDNTLSRQYEREVNQTAEVKNSGNFLTANFIPLGEDYTELFYMIDERVVPFI
jgi:hypothetical protein